MTIKELNEMELHQEKELVNGISVLRVPNGWIYQYHENRNCEDDIMCTQFVDDNKPNYEEEFIEWTFHNLKYGTFRTNYECEIGGKRMSSESIMKIYNFWKENIKKDK